LSMPLLGFYPRAYLLYPNDRGIDCPEMVILTIAPLHPYEKHSLNLINKQKDWVPEAEGHFEEVGYTTWTRS
jgi:hypothetical protein